MPCSASLYIIQGRSPSDIFADGKYIIHHIAKQYIICRKAYIIKHNSATLNYAFAGAVGEEYQQKQMKFFHKQEYKKHRCKENKSKYGQYIRYSVYLVRGEKSQQSCIKSSAPVKKGQRQKINGSDNKVYVRSSKHQL